MTDIYIISGFLGAGKTTLIKTMVRSAFRNKEIVVIENDFGEAGIDAGLLRECNLAVTSLSDGCICCSLTGDFEKAIERVVKEYAPEAVLVEPSGVGKLSDIIKICFKQEDKGCLHLKKAITVVDVRSFDKYRKNYGEFFEDQIAYADLIMLSHQEEAAEEIRTVGAKLRELNPEARIEADFWESIPASVFRQGLRNSSIFRLEMETAVAMKPVRIRKSREQSKKAGFIRRHFAGEVFASVTIEWKEPLTEEQLQKKVMHVAAYAEGEILRGKGIVASGGRGLVFHYLPDYLSSEPVNTAGNQVCFTGTGLNEKQIRMLFSEETV